MGPEVYVKQAMRERLRFIVLANLASDYPNFSQLDTHRFLPAFRRMTNEADVIMRLYDERLRTSKCSTARLLDAAVHFGMPGRMVLMDAKTRGFWFGELP